MKVALATAAIVGGIFFVLFYLTETTKPARDAAQALSSPENFCASWYLWANHTFDGRAKEFCRNVRDRQWPDRREAYEQALEKFGVQK